MRKNFAISLTKKKELLYWGDIVEVKKENEEEEMI